MYLEGCARTCERCGKRARERAKIAVVRSELPVANFLGLSFYFGWVLSCNGGSESRCYILTEWMPKKLKFVRK